MNSAPRHECLIYNGPPSRHLPALASATKTKLEDGYRCFYLNSPVMVAGMRSYLAASGLDVMSRTKSRGPASCCLLTRVI